MIESSSSEVRERSSPSRSVSAGYSLCPSVKVEDIVLQCLKAGAWLYRNAGEVGSPRNRIFVAGHSAGGHLTAMCMAAQWPRYSRGLRGDLSSHRA